jgi:hypothetical protein
MLPFKGANSKYHVYQIIGAIVPKLEKALGAAPDREGAQPIVESTCVADTPILRSWQLIF